MSKRLALVVGNATFPSATDLTDLRTPLNDANAVASTLDEFSDFDVTEVLLDQNASVLKERIEAFFAEAQRGDAALIYYSGHGFKNRSGELYLAAYGTNTDRPLSTAVEADFLRRAMQQSRCKHIVVVLDSCYSGAFDPRGKGTETPEFLEALGGETIAVLASSRGGQLSFEGDGDLSRFTQAMLEGIRTARADTNADGEITLQEVFDYTRDQLGPDQTPSFRLGKAGDDIVMARGIQERPAAVYLAAVEEDAYLRTWLTAKLSLAGYRVQHLSFAGEPAAATWLERLSRTAGAFVPLFSGEAIRDDDFTAQLRVASEANKYRPMLVPVDAGGWYEETFTFDPGRSADFTRNWADGLKQVEGLLNNLGVPKEGGPDATQLLHTWKQDLGVRDSLLATKREAYRSNWFRVLLPEHLYVHAFNPGEQPRMNDFAYPAVMDPGYLISFASGEHFKEHLGIWESYRIRVTDFLGRRDFLLEDGSQILQAGYRLIDLLNRVVSRHLLNKGLHRYEQSSDDVYYFDLDSDAERPHRKVSLKPVGHNWVQLTGVMRAFTWHYGVSVKPFLYPYPAIFLGAHIIFKDKGRLVNPKQQHRSRRRKGKGLYNKQWRDLLLGTMLYLADGEQRISIPTGSAVPIEIDVQPVSFVSPTGYREPTKEIEDDVTEDAEDLDA